jgi:hypothetical protein
MCSTAITKVEATLRCRRSCGPLRILPLWETTWRPISVVAGVRLLWFRHIVISATSLYLLGVAGFATTADYSYFAWVGFMDGCEITSTDSFSLAEDFIIDKLQ